MISTLRGFVMIFQRRKVFVVLSFENMDGFKFATVSSFRTNLDNVRTLYDKENLTSVIACNTRWEAECVAEELNSKWRTEYAEFEKRMMEDDSKSEVT